MNRRRRRLRPVMEPLESRLMLAMSRLVEPPVIIIPKAPIYAIGANAGQPPEVKVSDPVTGEQVSRFFAYAPRSRGGVNVAVADVNGDGVYDVITGPARGAARVRVIDGTKLDQVNPRTGEILPNALLGSFFVNNPGFGGVFVAGGDINGDGLDDVITGAGAGSRVQVIDATKLDQVRKNSVIRRDALLADFFAYDPAFRGGVRVAAGDIDGNARIDLITGPGPGRGPLVKVIDGTQLDQVDPRGELRASALQASFLAYDRKFRGGVYVGTGNIKGFAFTDISTGPGAGGRPLVKVFSQDLTTSDHEGGAALDLKLIDSFLAYPESYRGGVHVSSHHEATTFFGDNRDDVVATRATGDGTTPRVFPREIPLPAESHHHGDPIPDPIPQGSIRVGLTLVASGLVSPVYLTVPGDGTDRKFVVDQTGQVRLIENGQLRAQPFLDVSDRLVPLDPDYDERGLLGLAFHPGFNDPNSPGFHTLYTYTSEPVSRPADFKEPPFPDANVVPDHQSVIAEWKVSASDPDVVDLDSRREILRIDKPQFNHNGGTLAFGRDGFLYISVGDGGAANDVGPGHNPVTGNAQDLSTILGKVARIDPLNPALTANSKDPVSANGQYRIPADNPIVNTPNAVREIFAYGLRNPYRMSFDRADGKLVLADAGQDSVEEVDIITKGGNYGWHLKEGSFRFDPKTAEVSQDLSPDPHLIDPVVEYDHDDFFKIGRDLHTSIGGFVYHGSRVPELEGKYIFGDFAGMLFDVDLSTGRLEGLLDLGPSFHVKGFGQDAQGEVYVLGTFSVGPANTDGVVLELGPGAIGSLGSTSSPGRAASRSSR